MLVRLQLPQLKQTEVIRLDEEPVLKTGGGDEPLVSSSLGTAVLRGRLPHLSGQSVTRSRGLVAKAAPLQGDDRWFESTRDYSPWYAN